MATKTIEIVLEGKTFVVPKLNFGQLERVTLIAAEMNVYVRAFKILPIALERAEPKVEDFSALEPDYDEVTAATRAILDMCGLLKKEEAGSVSPASGGDTAPKGA
jgi:hypothetical protein